MTPAFLLASLLLAVSPGPGVAFIVARTLAGGRRAGLAGVAGIALGNFANALGAALGVAALLALAPSGYALLRYAGSGYLIWLGVQSLRAVGAPSASPAVPEGGARAMRDGLLVALLNPKTLLFFAAFLPQFVPPDANPALSSVGLGATFVAIAALTDSGYALAAGAAAKLLARDARARVAGRLLSAGVLIGLGLYAALALPGQ
ncbi:MAG: LysE family translocator [Rhodocyclaceae bacterium]|nr:LysE family translocator [Rhodocyclaceae bacterium]MBX3668813.1 LysE family translocator [Rhodocyclaceae bacterium]